MLNEEQKEVLSDSPLFRGVTTEAINKFLEYVGAFPHRFEIGEPVVEQGERQSEICVVLSGSARGEKLTVDGRSITVNEFMPGELFGDMLSGASEKSPVTVRMTRPGDVVKISFSSLINGGEVYTETRERILRNLINEISGKYFSLLKRLNVLLCPTLRGKIANYLLEESEKDKKMLIVPHDREDQARLLNCDRSALSRELSRMRAEGIIDFKGNRFEILDRERLKNCLQ